MLNHIQSAVQFLKANRVNVLSLGSQNLGQFHEHLIKSSPTKHFASIVINMLGLVMPLAMLQVYDRIIPNSADATLYAIIIILIVTTALEAILRTAKIYIDNFDAAKFSHNVLVDCFGRLLNPYGQEIGLSTPRKAIDRLEAISRLGGFLGGPARQIVVDLPFSLIFFITIAIVGGWLVVIPVTIAVVFGVGTFIYGRLLEKIVERRDTQETRIYEFISEVLSGITTVKGLSAERLMMRRFERLGKKSARNKFDLVAANDRAQIMAGSLGNVTTLSIVTAGTVLAVNGQISIGTIAACTLLSGRAVQPTLRIANIWNEYQRTKLTLREASRIAELPALSRSTSSRKLNAAPNIQFKNVVCSGGSDRPTFTNLNFEIEPNTINTFCGPNGTGKSTILKLIAGLNAPIAGSVVIGGLDAQTFRSTYKNSVGFVSPETAVFHATILENLTLNGAGCSQDTAFHTCALLGIEDEIYKFPDGYATELGGNAVEALPKGFIQRLMLARTLAQQPKVLILDEAQTFLDRDSDLKLRDYLKDLQFNSTIIQATNRLEYMQISNVIIDVSPGQINIQSNKDRLNSDVNS